MKAAIITGASAGIGAATAARFVASGWAVHGASRRASAIAGVVSHEVDLADTGALEHFARSLADELAGVERVCLVHNAAVMRVDGVDGADANRWEHTMRLNVIAPAVLTSRLRPLLRAGSSVIFVGSTLSEKAVPGRMSYVTSKHAIVGLMRALAQELFGSGVHTACVCPGFTDTAMLRPVLDASPAIRDAVLKMVSFGRLVDPAEIADLIAYVADHPVLNGAVLHANLGQRES